jgi:excisionase family DNA binding protein
VVELKIDDPGLLNKKLAFSIKELTELMPVSRDTVSREVKAGRLIVTILGRRQMFLAENVRKWLNSLPTSPYTAK